MNKFLITTALVASFVTTNAMATPEVSVNGSIDSKFVNNSQKEKFRYDNLDSSTGKKLSNNNIATDAYINFNIKGEVKEGLKYGGLIKLNANTSKSKKEMFDNDGKQSIAEQVMAYLESGYGRVEVGNYTGVTESMKVNAGTFASATGGINGDSQYYWNQNTVEEKAVQEKVKTKTAFLQTANLPTNELGTFGLRGVNAAKINYYTPEFSGFRFGATFTPNTKVHGTASSVTGVVKDKKAAGFKNVFETGLSYTSEIKDVGVKFAVVGEFGKNQESGNADLTKNKKNLRAYEVGTNLSYKGFTVGGSYGDWGKYGASTDANAPEFGRTSYWTAGVGYANGPLSTSVTHLQGKKGIAKVGENKKHNTLRNTVIGVDYKVAPGVMPYVEFSSFKMNQASQTDKDNNNKGHMIMTGVKLNF
jgi:predicted porin